MAKHTDLNPQPAVNPAAVDAKKKLPNAPAVTAEEAVDTNSWQGGFEAFKESFNRIKANPQPAYVIVGLYAAFGLISVLLSGETSMFNEDYPGYEDYLSIVLLLPMTVYALAIADKKHLSLKAMSEFNFKRFLMLLATAILAGLIIGFSILLFVVPVIWTLAWFAMSCYVLIDKKLGIVDSLQESKRLAQDHKSKVWGIVGVAILSYLPLIVLAQIPVVGAAYTGLLALVGGGASATLYRWLQRNVAE